jgi:hypothetical protein
MKAAEPQDICSKWYQRTQKVQRTGILQISVVYISVLCTRKYMFCGSIIFGMGKLKN